MVHLCARRPDKLAEDRFRYDRVLEYGGEFLDHVLTMRELRRPVVGQDAKALQVPWNLTVCGMRQLAHDMGDPSVERYEKCQALDV